ncbi:ERF family protein [Stenotrophomonas tumulicola]|uniref:ERF family protein n=1 Tax=Stenotrophomonas tumulicola TaxID=1685415 RepID=A0A7W3IGQ7_9GAMM|nr:ERF family protein [Stenotrophomonas tumulicola]MBA8680481.1 ERF family protein [Stenotrophomonas tumulicola]
MSEIVTITADSAQPTGLQAALQQALMLPEQGVERLERMWEMHKEMQDRDAAREYAAAMKRTQSRMPNIQKRGNNPQTKSAYALLEDINRAITPIYTEEGFSLSFGTVKSDLPDHVGIVCDVLHDGGHSRTYHYDAPIDNAGINGSLNKTLTHGRGSAISYGQRYLIKMIFNLTIGGEDDDGNGSSGGGIDPVALQWIAVADALKTHEDYKASKAKVLAAYGGKAANLPGPVREAYNRANEATKPKD